MRRVAASLALVTVVAAAAVAVAQDSEDPADDNGFIINFLQERISAPGRVIRLSGVQGALSSQARIGRLTIADDEGVWLELDGIEIDWTRRSLLLGRVNINRLSVEEIDVKRRPVPHEPTLAERLPEPEATPFSLPELPVSVQLQELALAEILLGEPVLGQAARLSATGSADLARGELDADLTVDRLDAAGGTLALDFDFSNSTRELALVLQLQEPQGGVVATALDIEDRPAIDVRLQGAGPLDALDVDFSFDAGDTRIASGEVELRGSDAGLGFTADFDGELSPVVPAQYRDFFAGQTSVGVSGVNLAAGGLRLDRLAVSGAALELTGALQTTADYFPRNLTLSGRIGDPRAAAVTLPVPGGETSLNSAVLHLSYGDGRRWSGLLALDRLKSGDIEIEDLTLSLGGIAENIDDPARRNLTVALDGVATGVWSSDPDKAAVLGDRLDIFADAALPAGGPLRIRQAQISGNGLSAFAAGTLEGTDFDGRASVRLADLAPASGLAGRELGGALSLDLVGSVQPLDGAFDLALDGTADDLRLGDPRIDGLLAGETTLGGQVARGPEGIRTDGFRLANPQLELTSSGALSSNAADLVVDARLNELNVIDPRLSGALIASGRATGEGGPINVDVTARVPEGEALDRAIEDLALGFRGEIDGATVDGALSGGGSYGGQPVELAGEIDVTEAARTIRGLRAGVGPNLLTGDVTQTPETGLFSGDLALDAPDVTPLAALALTEATGAVQARIGLDADGTGQGVTVSASIRDLAAAGARVGALDLDATVEDAFAAPMVQGSLSGQDVAAGGLDVATLSADVEQTGPQTMDISADARLAVGADISIAGAVTRQPDGFEAALNALSLQRDELSARLAAPATVTVAGETIRLTPLTLDLGRGRLTAEGEIAESLDLDLTIDALPLALANAVAPGLGLAGTIDGTARVTGPRAEPNVAFDVRGRDLASSATASAGLPPAQLSATGRTTGDRLQVDANIRAAGGIEARAAGSLPLGGAGPLQMNVNLASFPLAAVDRIAGNRGLAGTVSGRAQVAGTLAAPEATFDLRGAGLTATPLSGAGVSPIDLTANGRFAQNALTLTSARASNPQGLSVTASGRAPLSGPGLDVRAEGSVPLLIADTLLASRTARATGDLRFNVGATGSIANPQLSGSASLAGGTFSDPETNIRLRDIGLDVGLQGQQVTLRSLRASPVAGGQISADGTISLAPGNPADLRLRLDGVRYTDGSFVTTTIDGQLALNGPATGGGGVIRGEINLGRTEISVAEGLGQNVAILNEVRHVNTPADVELTLERANVGEPSTPQPTGRGGLETDIRINAPNRIFVRGRGLDVELGGSLRITGPTNDLSPVGQFDLRRGRLEILGQRIDFDEGSLRLVGNLDPEIYLVAETRGQDVTAFVTVSGRASSPEVTFSSSPPLPQDEVLAQVLFNRNIADLSAFQIAQLAAAAAELAGGGGGPGILSQLRSAIGFDDLDVITNEEGETAVSAGTYIDDNIYLDVQTDTRGEARAQINLDVNRNLTVRGSVASDGNSTIGLFYERDY